MDFLNDPSQDPCKKCLINMICSEKNSFLFLSCKLKINHYKYLENKKSINQIKRKVSYDQVYRRLFKKWILSF